MWSCGEVNSLRYIQIEKCASKVRELIGKDIFYRVKSESSPINSTPFRFAAMCVAYSKGNHV